MSFSGAISGLFNCGRPRRPQTRDRDNRANPGKQATQKEDDGPAPDFSNGTTVTVCYHEEEPKAGKGLQFDKRILVKADKTDAGHAAVERRLNVGAASGDVPLIQTSAGETVKPGAEDGDAKPFDASPAPLHTTPAPLDTTPALSDTTPARPDMISAPSDTIPALLDATPAPSDTIAASLAATSAPLDITPATLETTPTALDAIPAPADAIPAPVDETPAPVDATSAPLGTVPAPSNTTPAPLDATLPLIQVDELQTEDVQPEFPNEAFPFEAEKDVEEAVMTEKLPDELNILSTAATIPEPREDDATVLVPRTRSASPPLVQPTPIQTAPTQTAPIQATPKTTLQFLGLPTEIRRLMYEHMTEENPIRMVRHDDPVLSRTEPTPPKRQFYSLTQVCRQLRKEFLPLYEQQVEYIIDLWAQRANLPALGDLKGDVAIDIDAACFDMQPIDLLPLIRYLSSTRKARCRFVSTEGFVFRSIDLIVKQLNKLLPAADGSNSNWLAVVNGPMKRIDLHLFPHEDIRAYYRFRGAEPMMRIVYPSRVTEDWMKQSHKAGGEYETYLRKAGLDGLDMHVVVGHASRRITNPGKEPLDWRLSYVDSRLSIDQASRISGQYTRVE